MWDPRESGEDNPKRMCGFGWPSPVEIRDQNLFTRSRGSHSLRLSSPGTMAHSASLYPTLCFHADSTSNSKSRLFLCPPPPKLIKFPRTPPVSAVATELPLVDGATIAAIGGGSVAALAALVSLTDPERRRRLQAEEVGGVDKDVVREYFNNSGFQRWKKIYGETDDVNRVQRDIRLGHSKTVENVMAMLKDDGPLAGVTVCDAGCGTGSLSIPLAKEGAIVFASDISAAMVLEAQNKVQFLNFSILFLNCSRIRCCFE